MNNVNCNRCTRRAIVIARVGGNVNDPQSGSQEFLCDDCRRSIPMLRDEIVSGEPMPIRAPGQPIRLIAVLSEEAL